MVYKSLDNKMLSSDVYHLPVVLHESDTSAVSFMTLILDNSVATAMRCWEGSLVIGSWKSSINNQIFEVRLACWVFFFSFSIEWTFKTPQCCSERVVGGGRLWTVHGLVGNEGWGGTQVLFYPLSPSWLNVANFNETILNKKTNKMDAIIMVV